MSRVILTAAPYWLGFLTVTPLLLLGLPGRKR